MSAVQPLMLDQVCGAKWQLVAHLNLGDVHVTNRRCVDYPRLVISEHVPKGRRSKAKPRRVFLVAGIDGSFPTLAAAIDALNALEAAE